jgi:hypothetical protein
LRVPATFLVALLVASVPRVRNIGLHPDSEWRELMLDVPTTQIEMVPIGTLKPYSGNARTHSKRQLAQIATSIKRFGFTNPVLISDDGEIIAGHGRVTAAKELGLATVPTIRLSHLSAAERRAYVIADNKLAENAGWDAEILAIELQALIDLEFDVTLTGFSVAEIDLTLDLAREASHSGPEDVVPIPAGPAVTRPGDLWHLGAHRLLCGDARSEDDVAKLMAGRSADLIFTDPPYNVRVDGHVGGLGSVKHREFAFASGEMSAEQFTVSAADPGQRRIRGQGRGDRVHLHGLAAHTRAARCRRAGVLGAEEPLRVEQEQWWHGEFLSLQA